MDSKEADLEVPESHAPSHHPEVERAMPSAPSLTIEKDGATDKAERPDTAMRDHHKPPDHESLNIGDEIQALKAKILELEQHAKAGPDVPGQEASPPQLMTEMEQYKRMEACLYRHRKEWEQGGGPGSWNMGLHPKDYHSLGPYKHGPWNYHWILSPERNYKRPDPFDPSHICADDQRDREPPLFDDFDHTIDYGSRRERLRKNFEWEMDRLYLVEEIDLRRKAKDKEHHTTHDGRPEQNEQAAHSENKESMLPEVGLDRLEWFNFKRSNVDGGFVIEILKDEPILDDFGPYQSWYGYSGRRTRTKDKSLDHKTSPATLPEQKPLPERIRIRSPVLLQILRTILGAEQEWLSHEQAVLIRPFKALVYCERALRDWCSALEKRFQALSSTKRDGAADGDNFATPPQEEESSDPHQAELDASQGLTCADTTSEKPSAANSDSLAFVTSLPQQCDHSQRASKSDQNKEEQDEEEQGIEKDEDGDDEGDDTKSPMALQHLKCLLSFIDSDISARQTYLSHHSCRKIVFSDLWLLFRPGTEVIGGDGKQAYRVIHTTSAKHRATPTWQAWINQTAKKRKDSPFSITCVYIDFDGKDLGPVQRVFDFKKFDGETEIGSLEVYPLQFHPAKETNFSELEWEKLKAVPAENRQRQRLIDRGAKFLDVAAVKHMYYAGPTLEVRDEVESQVVVDFETAFSMGENTGESWKPDLRPLVGVQAVEDEDDDDDADEDYPCRADCCYGQLVHDDTYVDQKQRDEYVENHLPKVSAPDEQPSIAIIPRPLKELLVGDDRGASLSDDELVIMSYRVFGFVLRNRKWGTFTPQALLFTFEYV